jgi:hypothetical protein
MRTAFLLSLTTALFAGTARGAVVENTKFKGKQAATSFSASASLTCADGTAGTASASGFLSGATQLNKSKGSPKTLNNGIFMEVSYSNSCTSVSVSFADGGIADGFTPPNKKLESAALDGTGTVQDFNTGATVSVTLAVDFVGVGPLDASRSSSHTRTVQTPGGPITITETHSDTGSRGASASGTIVVDGVTFDPTYSSTDMSFNRSSEIVIEKP